MIELRLGFNEDPHVEEITATGLERENKSLNL
jgi:hypothetical protein